MVWILYFLLVAGGYVASIYTWPAIRSFLIGAQAEAENLRIRVRNIENAIRGK